MKMIFIIILLVTLLLIGCDFTAEESAQDNRWVMPRDTWEQMENVFEKVEDELVRFVTYLKENELLDKLEGFRIRFIDDEESAKREANHTPGTMGVAVHSGEIINAERLWGTASMFRDDPELISIVKAIDRHGIIAYIDVERGADDATIWFMIKPEHPYIADIRGMQNNFFYIEGDAYYWRDLMQVRENWYMDIIPPHD
jgi:hypothetical protein